MLQPSLTLSGVSSRNNQTNIAIHNVVCMCTVVLEMSCLSLAMKVTYVDFYKVIFFFFWGGGYFNTFHTLMSMFWLQIVCTCFEIDKLYEVHVMVRLRKLGILFQVAVNAARMN